MAEQNHPKRIYFFALYCYFFGIILSGSAKNAEYHTIMCKYYLLFVIQYSNRICFIIRDPDILFSYKATAERPY